MNDSNVRRNDNNNDHDPSSWNPCQAVRDSCQSWMVSEPSIADGGRRSVSIDPSYLSTLATSITRASSSKATGMTIEWDTEGWHYDGSNVMDATVRHERVGLYLLALDAINFCFWPTTDNGNPPKTTNSKLNSLEYHHLALAMKAVAEMDDADCCSAATGSSSSSSAYAFSPPSLRDMTATRMHDLLQPHLVDEQEEAINIPNLEQRAALWRQVGKVLLDQFDGSIHQFWSKAQGDARTLVSLVYHSFEGFQDYADVPGAIGTATTSTSSSCNNNDDDGEKKQEIQRIYFLKRAQILVGDWNAALPSVLKLNDTIHQLTTFADYRVPQLLRQEGVLVYDDDDKKEPCLTALVDGHRELVKSGCHEISIRAATVVAVEALVRCLNDQESSDDQQPLFTAVTVDWYLWQVGEARHQEGRLKPFHKVRTHFY